MGMGEDMCKRGGGVRGGEGTFWGLSLKRSVFSAKTVGSADTAKKNEREKYK